MTGDDLAVRFPLNGTAAIVQLAQPESIGDAVFGVKTVHHVEQDTLNGVAVVYDWEVDASGDASWDLWEWK